MRGEPASPPDPLRRGDGLALVALFLLVVLFHPGVFLRGETLVHRDLGFFFGPLREIAFREVAAGRLPLWNEHSLSGLPLLADPNAALFNPASWLWLLGGPVPLVLGTLFAALVAIFVALRKSGLGPRGAFVGASLALFGGAGRSAAPFPTILSTFCLVPLLLLALHRTLVAAAEGSQRLRRWIALLGVAGALLLVAGEPASSGMGFLAALAVAVELRGAWQPGVRRRTMAALGAAAAIALLLSAVQILPAAAQLGRAPRGGGLAAESGPLWWSNPPLRLATFLLPGLYGDPAGEGAEDFWGASGLDAGGFYLATLYPGLAALPLAAAAWRRRKARIALLLALGAAILSFGRHTPLGPLLLKLVPPLALFRYPEKWMLLAGGALAFAAAAGTAELLRTGEEGNAARNRFLGGATLTVVLLGTVGLFLALMPGSAASLLVRLRVAPFPLAPFAASRLSGEALLQLVVALALVGTGLLLRRHGERPLGMILLVVLALSDLLHRNGPLLPSSARSPFREGDEVTLALGAAAGGRPVWYEPEWSGAAAARAAGDVGGLDPAMPLVGVFHGLRYAGNNDVDRMGPRAAVEWAGTTARWSWGEGKLRRLRSAGVGALLTLSDLGGLPGVLPVPIPDGAPRARRVWKLLGSRDELAVVPEPRSVASAGEMERELARPADPLTTAVVLAPAAALPAPSGAPAGRVIRHERGAIVERATVEAEAPMLLVRARSFDPGLGAFVDGRPVPTWLADGMFTAFAVPAGRHEVELRYRSRPFELGAGLALGGLVLAALVALGGRRG